MATSTPPSHPRMNTYFLPRAGIDREVITADICCFLGRDATIRVGVYEHPDGRVTQGYYITAYRNLTSAMIEDLKANSARWEQEKRAAIRPSAGPAGAPPRGNDAYRNSEIHQRQQYGADPSYGEAMAVDPPYNSAPRYPGTGNSGYNGVNSGHYSDAQRYEPAAFPQAAQFARPQQSQYSPGPPQPSDMYPTMPAGSAAFSQRTSAQDPGAYVSGAQFRVQDLPSSVPLPNRSGYATSGPSYPPAADPYIPYPQAAGAPSPAYPQSIDTFYGRGGQPPSGYTPAPDPQYDGSQSPSRSPGPAGTQAQAPAGNAAAPRRDQDRLREREREWERERDRDSDRHAAERHAHRNRTRS